MLIGAESLDTIKQTHSHYFPGDLGQEFFDTVTVATPQAAQLSVRS